MRIYGIAEIAGALGVSPNLVKQWYRRGKLPAPDDTPAMGPAWSARRIEPWIERQRASR